MEIKFHGVRGGLRGYVWNGICISASYYDKSILIDCGNRQILKETKLLSQLEAILFTHTHWDHRAAFPSLMKKMKEDAESSGEERTIQIYSPDHFRSLPKQTSNGNLFIYKISRKIPESIGPFEIESLQTNHHKNTHAYKIIAGGKCFVYTADTGLFDGLYDFCRGADALIVESTFLDPWKRWTERRGHMIPEYAARLIEEANPGQAKIVHYMWKGETFKKQVMGHLKNFKGQVSVAQVGDCLVL